MTDLNRRRKKRTWSYFYIKHNLIQKVCFFFFSFTNRMDWFWTHHSFFFFFLFWIRIKRRRKKEWERMNQMVSLPTDIPLLMIDSICEQLSIAFHWKQILFFFNVCLFFFFCTNVQASSKRTGKHTHTHKNIHSSIAYEWETD
jgi:hypothetical protein